MDQHEPIPPEQTIFTPAELAGIAEGLADLDANGSVLYQDVLTWLNSLDTDNPLPEPQPS